MRPAPGVAHRPEAALNRSRSGTLNGECHRRRRALRQPILAGCSEWWLHAQHQVPICADIVRKLRRTWGCTRQPLMLIEQVDERGVRTHRGSDDDAMATAGREAPGSRAWR